MAKQQTVALLAVILLAAALVAVILLAVVLPAITLSGGGVADGDTVSVYYVGKLEDGTIFDSNTGEGGRAPLEFIVGQHHVVPGFENAVIGMKVNETKTVTLLPEDAYPYKPELVVTFNITDVVESLGSAPKIGDKLRMVTNTGDVVDGTVTEITPTTVIIDFNSELADKTLVFEITVVDIVKNEAENQ